MAHFYASIQGNRSERTCQGTKNSGIQGHIRGWESGVRVEGYHDEKTGEDAFRVYLTSGSNGRHSDIYLGKVIQGHEGYANHFLVDGVEDE